MASARAAQAAVEWAAAEGWNPGLDDPFETAGMYLSGRRPEDVEPVFGVTTLEFG